MSEWARISDLERENTALRALLKECSDDLVEWVENYYELTKDYPSERRRYERDMAPALRARAVLSAHPEVQQ